MVEEKVKKRNPKAFIYNSSIRAKKGHARRLDLKTLKHHLPTVSKEQELPPPMVVGIIGPPKSGKSTLLASLIRHYTKSPVCQINGPITVVTGKRRRLTFIECNNDINSMADLSKVVDLALLVISAKDGLQMEIFEFLSMIQVAGFPKVMGILTFLDRFTENKTLKVYKRKIKDRFWSDVYAGAKVFYLTGFKYSSYGKREVINLARFISLAKPPQLSWRTSHPYVLCDRMEDITDPEKIRLSNNNNSSSSSKKCDRTIAIYGYVQGTHLKASHKIHVMGVGDYSIGKIGFLPDPCPFPDHTKNRRLDIKEKLVYAPFSSINNILFDKDAVYIDVGQSQMYQKHAHNTSSSVIVDDEKEDNEGADAINIPADNKYISAILDMKYSLKDKLKASTFKLTNDVIFEDEDSSDDEYNKNTIVDDEEEEEENNINTIETNINTIDSKRIKASHQNVNLHLPHIILKQLIYGKQNDDQMTIGESKHEKLVGDLFFHKKLNQSNTSKFDNSIYDCTRTTNKYDPHSLAVDCLITDKVDWKTSNKQLIYKYFVTGQSENLEQNLSNAMSDYNNIKYGNSRKEGPHNLDNLGGDVFGDFEDLEQDSTNGDDQSTDEEDKSDDNEDEESVDDQNEQATDDDVMKQKIEKKQLFDSAYDAKELSTTKSKIDLNGVIKTNDEKYTEEEERYLNQLKKTALEQKNLDDNEFKHLPADQRVMYEGYRPGMYVRIEIENIENEFVTHFNPKYPLIVGGILAGEDQLGYLNCRIKKHKWYKRVLKNNDPVIVSLGWRRFQTIASFSTEDHNKRKRYIKYTPAHLHCYATCYGPLTTPGVGVYTLQVPPYIRRRDFRITTTGVTIEVDKSLSIVKKLKLIGTPCKIFKNTAFIKGMFSDALEVTKFEGANINTVSGIRGHVKKADNTNNGNFRATFEDKILMSDIVFLKTWIPVELPKFYLPIKTLLLPSDNRLEWIGMKTVGTLRFEQNLPYPNNLDSHYKPVERQPRAFPNLVIPDKLQKELPFKSKPKVIVRNANLPSDPTMVGRVLEPHEKKAVTLMKEILLSNKDINQKRALKRRADAEEYKKKKAKEDHARTQKMKEKRRDRFRYMAHKK